MSVDHKKHDLCDCILKDVHCKAVSHISYRDCKMQLVSYWNEQQYTYIPDLTSISLIVLKKGEKFSCLSAFDGNSIGCF